MPTWDLEPEPEQAAEADQPPLSVNALATNRIVPAGDSFDLEYAGSVVRVWCRACDKHEELSDDRDDAVDEARAAHRCDARTSEWGSNDRPEPPGLTRC